MKHTEQEIKELFEGKIEGWHWNADHTTASWEQERLIDKLIQMKQLLDMSVGQEDNVDSSGLGGGAKLSDLGESLKNVLTTHFPDELKAIFP